MFESEKKLRAYLQNVTSRLGPGCFFIGTTVDSDELIRRIRREGDKNKIGNSYYSVVLPSDSFDKSQSPFGHKYYFYLKDAIGKETLMTDDERPKFVDEYLIVFSELERIAKEYGLSLVMKKNFR